MRANSWLRISRGGAPRHPTSTTSASQTSQHPYIVHLISIHRHHISFWDQLHLHRITVKDHRLHIASLDQSTHVLDSTIAIEAELLQWKVISALHVSRVQRELTYRHSSSLGQCQPHITHRARPIWTRHSPLHVHTYRQRSGV